MGKVIYILSAGHSGSTLLDLAIGSHSEVFSTGELMHLSWQIERGPVESKKQTFCSCGADFRRCTVWNKIIGQIETKHRIPVYKHPHQFKLAPHHSRNHKRSIKTLIIQKILMNNYQSIFGLLFSKLLSIVYRKTITNNWHLFDEICNVTNTKYVIDSSKNILRYVLLKRFRPNDIFLVILVRGIHGVASSSYIEVSDEVINKRTKGWIRLYKNRVPKLIRTLKQTEYLAVRYEDFCENPNEKITNICNHIGLNNTIKELEINTNHRHLVAGNPIRHAGKIIIQKDNRWKQRLTKSQIESLNEIENDVYKYLQDIQISFI